MFPNNEKQIISYFFSTSAGVKKTARVFSVSPSFVGALINRYRNENNLRY